MIQLEYQSYGVASLEDYAQAVAKNSARPIKETRIAAKEQVKSLLKDGVDTKDHHMFVVVDNDTRNEIGRV